MLVVTTPASDPTLLSAQELRDAVGAADGSHDTALASIGRRVAAAIARVCGVAAGGAVAPTLRKETLTETFRLEAARQKLILARAPVVSVTSVVEDGITLAAADYEIDAGPGLLLRLDDDTPAAWEPCKITVVYSAGWETVPDDLKLAATKLVQAAFASGSRDPDLKRERVDGVGEWEYWVGPAGDPLVPDEVMHLLAPYVVHQVRAA